jgi:hypothetical protein
MLIVVIMTHYNNNQHLMSLLMSHSQLMSAARPKTLENRWTVHLHGPPALFWLSSYIASHHITVVPQSGTKDQFNYTVYYITFD